MSNDSFDTIGKNFFVQNDSFPEDIPQEPLRRLNDYDYNLLKEDAYKDVSDELFKLEYKISKLEDAYDNISHQIQSARDISDYDTVEHLINRKRQIKEDLDILSTIYNEKSLSSKISGRIFNIMSPRIKSQIERLNKSIRTIKNLLLSSLPGRLSSVQDIKQSLSRLENINKSVDELMTMQTPYGEGVDKYEQLSRYITRANAIQSKIAKILR